MPEDYAVVVAAGSFRSEESGPIHFAHRWTPDGVSVAAAFTGAHLLHLSVAGCVLNDLYREAGPLGITLDGVRVTASGDFDPAWHSTGIGYLVELDSAAGPDELARLLATVDDVAEIPHAVRAGGPVQRRPD